MINGVSPNRFAASTFALSPDQPLGSLIEALAFAAVIKGVSPFLLRPYSDRRPC